jgi:hypothetical protein
LGLEPGLRKRHPTIWRDHHGVPFGLHYDTEAASCGEFKLSFKRVSYRTRCLGSARNHPQHPLRTKATCPICSNIGGEEAVYRRSHLVIQFRTISNDICSGAFVSLLRRSPCRAIRRVAEPDTADTTGEPILAEKRCEVHVDRVFIAVIWASAPPASKPTCRTSSGSIP